MASSLQGIKSSLIASLLPLAQSCDEARRGSKSKDLKAPGLTSLSRYILGPFRYDIQASVCAMLMLQRGFLTFALIHGGSSCFAATVQCIGTGLKMSQSQVGLVSSWLFENMISGRTICFRGVDGNFTLGRIASKLPSAGLLLIAGGIGITPLRTMLHQCIAGGIPVTLLYCVKQQQDAVFKEEIEQVALERFCKQEQEGKAMKMCVSFVSTEDIAIQSLPMQYRFLTICK